MKKIVTAFVKHKGPRQSRCPAELLDFLLAHRACDSYDINHIYSYCHMTVIMDDLVPITFECLIALLSVGTFFA